MAKTNARDDAREKALEVAAELQTTTHVCHGGCRGEFDTTSSQEEQF